MKRICAAGCTGLMLAGCVTAPEKPDSPRRPVEGMPVSGETLFHRYCSSCHGTDATGKGPIARLLKHPPPDLRTFTRRRNGQFSSVELARFIDGRQEVPAHGSRVIPVWGKQFARIEVESTERESLVSGNLLELVLYIESIQQN